MYLIGVLFIVSTVIAGQPIITLRRIILSNFRFNLMCLYLFPSHSKPTALSLSLQSRLLNPQLRNTSRPLSQRIRHSSESNSYPPDISLQLTYHLSHLNLLHLYVLPPNRSHLLLHLRHQQVVIRYDSMCQYPQISRIHQSIGVFL